MYAIALITNISLNFVFGTTTFYLHTIFENVERIITKVQTVIIENFQLVIK